MIHFTCTHCQKEINGVAILLDKTHFLHKTCEESFRKENGFDTIDEARAKFEEEESLEEELGQ